MDFLLDLGFDEDLIEKIKNNNSPTLVFTFICNKNNAIKLIDYFKQIGIKDIDKLLLSKLEIFSIDYHKILEAFNNEDINMINFL